MPSWRLAHTIALLIAWLTFLIFIEINEQPQGRFSLLWRKALHQNSCFGLARQYQAPLVGCDRPDRIEESYCVFLHHSAAFEDHERAVGQQADFGSLARRVFNERRAHGPIYCAEGIDSVALSGIRADFAVDMVQCETSGAADESMRLDFYGNWYEADLAWQEGQPLIEGSYTVFLYPGFSFEGHKRVVERKLGVDLVAHSVSLGANDRVVSYHVEGIDEAALDAIRGDRAVNMVNYTQRQDDGANDGVAETMPVHQIVL